MVELKASELKKLVKLSNNFESLKCDCKRTDIMHGCLWYSKRREVEMLAILLLPKLLRHIKSQDEMLRKANIITL